MSGTTPFFFDGWASLGRTALAGMASYVVLVVVLRVSGKRTLAKMNAFDFVVTIAIGSLLASLFTSRDLPLANGFLALALLVALQYVVAVAARRSHRFERLVTSAPRAVFRDNGFDEEAMRQERLTRDQVLATIRKEGFLDLEEVSMVVLETDGSLSVLRSCAGEPRRATARDVATS